jgi:hypothetical protein
LVLFPPAKTLPGEIAASSLAGRGWPGKLSNMSTNRVPELPGDALAALVLSTCNPAPEPPATPVDPMEQLRVSVAALAAVDVAAMPDTVLSDDIDRLSAILVQLDGYLSSVADNVRARGFRIEEEPSVPQRRAGAHSLNASPPIAAAA